MAVLGKIISYMLNAVLKVLRGGFGRLIAIIGNFVKTHWKNFIDHPIKSIVDGIKKVLFSSVTINGWFVLLSEFGKKILGYLAIITGISSGTLGAKQIFDFAKAIIDPQQQMLDWLSEAFSSLPSLQGLISSIDSFMSSLTAPYFTPPITFTYLLQVTAVGECFNQYLQALISTLIFVFSIFIIRWAFMQNFTFTKEVPK